MSHYQKDKYYDYVFASAFDQFTETMSPIEAHKFAHKHKLTILRGPNYIKGKKEKEFDGWGWHSSLQRSFKGPADYRQYLKANNMHEVDIGDRPCEGKYEPPVWNEDLIRKAINEYKIPIGSVMAEALLSGELDFPEE